MKPYLIGIAGGTCSGKTTIARALARHPRVKDVARLELDAYYHGLSGKGPQEIMHHNFDDPAALDSKLLAEHVRLLAANNAIEVPVYDMATHTRHKRTTRLAPAPFIIIEGLWSLYWEEIRTVLHTKVYVDAPHDVCLERRMVRDLGERGRTADEVRERFEHHVIPMHAAHVLPSRRYADVIVDGTEPVDASVGTIVRHITSRVSG